MCAATLRIRRYALPQTHYTKSVVTEGTVAPRVPVEPVKLGHSRPPLPGCQRAIPNRLKGQKGIDVTDSKPIRLIDRHELRRRIPLHYVSIWKRMKAGTFPAPYTDRG